MHGGGFVYPNEHVEWGLMIVMYPYITGIVAGAFIVSSLYHVFKVRALAPLGKLSLLVSLAFLCFATTPLLLHLGHPERSFFIMIRPNLYSAMSGFGFIYSFYMGLVLLEIWFIFRPFIVDRSQNASTAIVRAFYSVLALGVREIPEQARRIDEKIIMVLAGVGIPAACILHGYVGFIFGAIKANVAWSSPLTPVIFLMSAVISGIAALVLIYFAIARLRGVPADPACVRTLIGYLWGFLIIGVAMELLEAATRWYEHSEEYPMFQRLVMDELHLTFVWGQLIVGSGVSFLLLAVAVLAPIRPRVRHWLAGVASLLILLQVLCMRWNVVIGGQLLSKTGRGFHEFHMEWLGKEGILAAIAVFVAPFILLYFLIQIFRPFDEEPAVVLEPTAVPGPTVSEKKKGWGQPTPPPRPRPPVPTRPCWWS
jgi:Ni/Fe-hydrogenase subunit HybB-like protein